MRTIRWLLTIGQVMGLILILALALALRQGIATPRSLFALVFLGPYVVAFLATRSPRGRERGLPATSPGPRSRWLRFSIWQIMALGVVAALLSSVARTAALADPAAVRGVARMVGESLLIGFGLLTFPTALVYAGYFVLSAIRLDSKRNPRT